MARKFMFCYLSARKKKTLASKWSGNFRATYVEILCPAADGSVGVMTQPGVKIGGRFIETVMRGVRI